MERVMKALLTVNERSNNKLTLVLVLITYLVLVFLSPKIVRNLLFVLGKISLKLFVVNISVSIGINVLENIGSFLRAKAKQFDGESQSCIAGNVSTCTSLSVP